MHLGDGHGFRQGNDKGVGKQGIGNANVREFFVQGPEGGQLKAVGLLCERNLRLIKLAHDLCHGPFFTFYFAGTGAAKLLAVGVFKRGVVEKTVQERSMGRVDAHFKCLKPIAMPQAFECEGVSVRCFETIEFCQGWRCTAFCAHPCKQNATAFLDGVIALLDARAQNAAFGLGWRF